MYRKINITKFEGLNSVIAPELIKDGEARDILNYRMEKVGKLVSRNGYVYGMFNQWNATANPTVTIATEGNIPNTYSEDETGAPYREMNAYIYNLGIVGIGEITLSEKWVQMDTDKFMVYYIRGMSSRSDDKQYGGSDSMFHSDTNTEETYRFRGMYLFSPITGRYSNVLLLQTSDGGFGYIADKMDVNPQGMNETMANLNVANRYLPAYINPRYKLTADQGPPHFKYNHWIDYYIQMHQYRRSLIISDRINGDLLIEDEYDRQKYQGNNPSHELHIRPNTLSEFDIDIIEFDIREEADQENDQTTGVESGMALYNYTLPKKVSKEPKDHFANTISNPDFWDVEGADEKTTEGHNIRTSKNNAINEYLSYNKSTTLLTFKEAYAQNLLQHFKYVINHNEEYIFTNNEFAEEYDDLLGILELPESEYKDDNGNIKKEKAANVKIWDDLKFQYYMCSGKNKLINKFLTDYDKDFDKTIPGLPRITKLETINEYGQKAPLGVWRYRYVWDYGNGIYSSPSSEMLAPDILWSAVTDDMIEGSSALNNSDGVEGIYERYKKISNVIGTNSFIGQYTLDDERYTPYKGQESSHLIRSPNIWYNNNGIITLTNFGQLFKNVKSKLYTGHRFGVNRNNIESSQNDYEGIKNRGEFNTLVTLYFKSNDIETKGFAWEGCLIDFGMGVDGWKVYGKGQIMIPVFQTSNKPVTYNSVFDDYGRLRMAYINPYYPKYELVSPGFNSGIGGIYFNNYKIYILAAAAGVESASSKYEAEDPNLYFNIVPMQYDLLTSIGIGNGDYNNSSTAQYQNILLEYLRSNTILRAVKNDKDRLLNVNPNTKNDIVDRLILRGIAEIPLAETGDNISMQSEKIFENNTTEKNTLDYDTYRESTTAIWTDQKGDTGFDTTKDDNGVYIGEGYIAQSYKDYSTQNTQYNTTKYNVIASYEQKARDDFYKIQFADLSNIPRSYAGIIRQYIQFKITNVLTSEQETELTALAGSNIKIFFHDISCTGSNKIPIGYYTIYQYNKPEQILLLKENYINLEWLPSEAIPPVWTFNADTTSSCTGYFELIESISLNNTDTLIKNVDISLYAGGDRFIGVEQLTSYFPSSLMFDAPRLGIKIANADVPKRAKRLLIFRTLASHKNDYETFNYGLVKEVKIKRDSNDNVITEMDDNTTYNGLYFFDDIKDKNLDFGVKPGDYDGFQTALKSRFNVSVNERMYFANFIETYQPKKPRKYEDNVEIQNTNYMVMPVDKGEGYDSSVNISYKYIYKDIGGVVTLASTISNINIDGVTTNKVVVLYYLPRGYDESIVSLEIYRSIHNSDYYFIGEIKKDGLGIFVDDNIKDGAILPSLEANIENYESGIRWSELYRPDWIKANSFVEAKSGDGSQITGLQILYGNLIVFKETSIHRYAVQGGDIPISRTDEVSARIGCIAPNTLINVNNTLYFLSWEGFMKYDNNVLQKIDIKFDEELQFVMQSNANMIVQDYTNDLYVKSETIRDSSAGYNTAYNEIYLNIPMLPTLHNEDGINDGKQLEIGHATMYQESDDNTNKTYYDRPLLGHIYIINIDKGYNTKYAYPVAYSDPRNSGKYIRDIIDPSQLIRLYHTNTLGEFRSADIFPIRYNSDGSTSSSIIRAGIYIESPYRINSTTAFKDTDDILDGISLTGNILAGTFPTEYILQMPIKSIYKSKYFTGDAETLIKRLRQIGLNIFSRGSIKVVCKVFPFETENQAYAGERIDDQLGTYLQANQILALVNETFDFNPSITSTHPISNVSQTGTGTNILHAIPRSIGSNAIGGIRSEDTQGETGDGSLIVSDKYNDWYGKPIRVSLEITTEMRTQLNGMTLNWRPIHSYLV